MANKDTTYMYNSKLVSILFVFHNSIKKRENILSLHFLLFQFVFDMILHPFLYLVVFLTVHKYTMY